MFGREYISMMEFKDEAEFKRHRMNYDHARMEATN